jgi:hypothetical protein
MGGRARLVGAALIAEALLVAATRLLTLVYVVARQAYVADRFRSPLRDFAPWLLGSVAVVAVLLWAGTRFRTAPEGPWRGSGPATRVAMLAALALNVAACVRGVGGFAGSLDRGAQVLVAWGLLAAVCGGVSVGIVTTAGFLAARNGPADLPAE